NERSVRVLKNQEMVTFREPKSVLGAADGSGMTGVPGVDSTPLSGVEAALFESLRGLRRDIATELKVPPFAVFAGTTLDGVGREVGAGGCGPGAFASDCEELGRDAPVGF